MLENGKTDRSTPRGSMHKHVNPLLSPMSNTDGSMRDEIKLAEHGLRTSRQAVGIRNIVKLAKPTAVMPKSLRESHDRNQVSNKTSSLLPEIRIGRNREEFKSSVFQTKNHLL